MYLQSEVYKKRVETSVLAINVLKPRAHIPELVFVRVHMPEYLSLGTFPSCQYLIFQDCSPSQHLSVSVCTDALREASLHKRSR